MQETKRMNNLVKEMLDLSRAEQVDIQFRDATTVVNDVVNQVYNDFKMIHPDFVFMLDDDLHRPVKVRMHRDHLEQVLIILCDNAIKYSTERKEVHITLSKSLDAVEIAVQDFGEGIAPDETKKVFDRFYRVDKARSRKKGGNGLGLAIAKRLVEGYHGTISLESSLGYGSVFRVTLPIIDD
jgi:signal transduction histidine kinase